MPRSIEHSATYDCPPAAVHAALTDEQYWRARVSAVEGPGATLDSVAVANGGIEVTLTQIVEAKNLPAIVGKITSGDLTISRTESWGPLEADAATGAVTTKIAGTPATVRGVNSLTGTDSRTTLRSAGDATVPIPLIGGKIEQAVADNVTRLLIAEQQFTEHWLTRK